GRLLRQPLAAIHWKQRLLCRVVESWSPLRSDDPLLAVGLRVRRLARTGVSGCPRPPADRRGRRRRPGRAGHPARGRAPVSTLAVPGPSEAPAWQTARWLLRPVAFMESCRRRFGETFGVRFLNFQTPMV